MTNETCANCRRIIGKLELPNVWGDSVVCDRCHERLAIQLAGATPNTGSSPARSSFAVAAIACATMVFLVLGGIVVRDIYRNPGRANSRLAGNYAKDHQAGWAEGGLFAAIDSGDLNAVRSALGSSPDVNAGDKYGNSPLHHVAERAIDYDSDNNSAAKASTESLTVACIKMLISRGADVNIRGQEARTPLFSARNDEVARDLVQNGADVNAIDEIGSTPIFWSNALMAKSLAELGAKVDAVDAFGDTPLHEAASSGDVATGIVLISAGANINAINTKGQTPLKLAQLSFRDKMIEFLQLHGAK